MSATGLAVFDTTVQDTNLWLKALAENLGLDDRHACYGLLRATLHALRDRIGPENAVHLGAQLPMLLRGLYYEGWRISGTPTRERHIQEFLERVREELPQELKYEIKAGVRAVFLVLWEKIDPDEAEKVIGVFPKELRELWPARAG